MTRTLAATHAVEIEDAYPLASIQSDMLIDGVSSPGSGAYVQQAICDLREPVEPALLEAAWRHLLARHAMLRTHFRLESGSGAIQEVHREVEIPLAHLDGRGLSHADRESRFEAHLEAEAVRDFEFERSPPLRPALWRLADDHFRFLLTYHHALLDGRSIRVVMRELFDAYDALRSGREPELPPTRPYRTYIDWLAKQDAAAAEGFWRDALAGFHSTTRLPVERSATRQASGHGTAELSLSRESTDALRSFAQAHGLTLNTLLLGAWAQLLARYGGETDVAFDVTLALRGDRADPLRDVMGPCINAVPVRVQVDPETALLPWLAALRGQWLAMRPHGWLPRARIHRCSGTHRGERAMSSLVVYERGRLATNVRDDRKEWVARVFSHRSRGSHPLTLVAFELSGLLLKLVYSRSRYDAPAIERMLGHLSNLLEGASEHGDKALKAQPLLSPREKRRILVDWNHTTRDFPRVPVHALFERQAARCPDAVAVESNESRLTYRELDGRANQLARDLARRGVGAETLVGLCLDRTPELVVAVLAILKAGGAYLPLDPAHPAQRLQAILGDAGIAAVIATRERAALLGEAGGSAILLDAHRDQRAGESTASLAVKVDPRDLAYVVYTSGSTGRPKGISIPHRALTNHTLALAEHYAVTANDRRLQFVSIGADALIADLFPVLIRGGTVVLRPDEELLAIDDFLRFIDAHQVTMTGIPSAYWHEWVEAMRRNEAPPVPASLRVVVSGMDSVRPELFETWRSRVRNRVRWANAYGPSEATCTTTIYEPDLASDAPLERIPIGRPIANVRAYILDHHREPVPVGVPGEIWIGGSGVARGYRNRPDLTAESFVHDPFGDDPDDRLYRSGDLGRYLPDGNIEFLGRVDKQIKIRGYRVEPAEIEAALRRLAHVRQAVVVARASADAARTLCGYVTPLGQRPDAGELRRQLGGLLPDYMVPSAIVVLDAFPLTPNGKIDYTALPAPEDLSREGPRRHVPPKDALEEQIAGIWRDLLRIPRVGARDDFFDLGGDSLLAMRLMSALKNIRGAGIPLATFFADATVEGLAAALRALPETADALDESAHPSSPPAAVAIERAGASEISAESNARLDR